MTNSKLNDSGKARTCDQANTGIARKPLGHTGTIKDAMPVSFRSILFTSYILTIFKQRNLLPYK